MEESTSADNRYSRRTPTGAKHPRTTGAEAPVSVKGKVMQNHPPRSASGGRCYAAVSLFIVCAVLALSAAALRLVSITVNPDGTFFPNPVNIQAGDKVQWTNLSTTDSVVQIRDPALFLNSDPCGIEDDDLDHELAAADPNEFTGPSRQAVSGIFVLGQDGPGLVQRLRNRDMRVRDAGGTVRPSASELIGWKYLQTLSGRRGNQRNTRHDLDQS